MVFIILRVPGLVTVTLLGLRVPGLVTVTLFGTERIAGVRVVDAGVEVGLLRVLHEHLVPQLQLLHVLANLLVTFLQLLDLLPFSLADVFQSGYFSIFFLAATANYLEL